MTCVTKGFVLRRWWWRRVTITRSAVSREWAPREIDS